MIIYLILMIIFSGIMFFSENSFCMFMIGLIGFCISAILALSVLIGIG